MKAAVFRKPGEALSIEEVEVDDPGPGEVLVRTAASGVCHSDLHVIEGGLPVPPPCVLGHEPAGVVEAVGAGVTSFAPGDHVIGCISAFCGECAYCLGGRPYLCLASIDGSLDRAPGARPRLSQGGEKVPQFANLSSFAERMLCHQRALVKIRDDMPLDRAALIGCGVTTGLGAALNTVRIDPGQSVAIIGCGGVGLAALQGARIAGAGRIVAIDTRPAVLELAHSLGATDVVDASATDPVPAVQALTAGGVDFAFECIGLVPTVQQAVSMVGRGGTAVLVGVVPVTQVVPLSAAEITLSEKKVVGSYMGSNRFRFDMPRYVGFYLDGRLKLDEMITARIGLEDVNDALDALRAGEAVGRQVIVFEDA